MTSILSKKAQEYVQQKMSILADQPIEPQHLEQAYQAGYRSGVNQSDWIDTQQQEPPKDSLVLIKTHEDEIFVAIKSEPSGDYTVNIGNHCYNRLAHNSSCNRTTRSIHRKNVKFWKSIL